MEIEAKFGIPDESTFECLLATETFAGLRVGARQLKHVHDRYLDTADRAFLQAGLACRVRVSAGRALVTLKSATPTEGALHSRREMEVWIEAGTHILPDQWPASQATAQAQALSGGKPLQTLVEVWQERHIALLARPDTGEDVVELSLDRVRLVDSAQAEFLELEAELLPAGYEADIQTLIETFSSEWRLPAEPRSKFERGLALAHPELAQSLDGWRKEWTSKTQNLA